MSTYKDVQDFLNKFKDAWVASTTDEQKNSLAFARAVALIEKPTDINELATKVGVTQIKSDMIVSNLQIKIVNWLKSIPEETYYDLAKSVDTKGTTGVERSGFTNLKNFASLLGRCVDGDSLATTECKDAMKNIVALSIKDLVVPVKVAVGLLKHLGFKAGYGKYWVNSKEQNHFESVQEWAERNSGDKSKLDLTHSDYAQLREILNVYVRVANNHPDKWESEYVASATKKDEVDPNYPIPLETGTNNAVVLARLGSTVDTHTEMLGGILPIVWRDADILFGMSGGGNAGDHYVSEVDYIDAHTSVFRTGEVLKQYLNTYLTAIKNKGGQIDATEEARLHKLAEDLIKHEKSLIQVMSLLEKALALYQYYGKSAQVQGATNLAQLHSVVATSHKLFDKVSKGRRTLVGALGVLVKYLP